MKDRITKEIEVIAIVCLILLTIVLLIDYIQ